MSEPSKEMKEFIERVTRPLVDLYWEKIKEEEEEFASFEKIVNVWSEALEIKGKAVKK